MIKIVCDRCGKELFSRTPLSTHKITFIEGTIRTEYDLCKECLLKVRNFIIEASLTEIAEPLPCHKCESALSSECTVCDGQRYFRTKEGETDCSWK